MRTNLSEAHVAKPANQDYAELVTQHEQSGIVLSPEILLLYKSVNETLPVLIVQAIDGQLKREYRYALGGQIVAGLALILLAGGFVYLVMNGHERPAYALLGAGVLNVIGGFLRARLNDGGGKNKVKESKAVGVK
jgi:predicted neutral ceramidase superfamily lipid hydrolase